MGSVENSNESVGRAVEQLDDLMDELGLDMQKRSPLGKKQQSSEVTIAMSQARLCRSRSFRGHQFLMHFQIFARVNRCMSSHP